MVWNSAFFDQMPLEDLETVMSDVVILMDSAQQRRFAVPDPRQDPRWQVAAGEALWLGGNMDVTPEYLNALAAATGILHVEQKEPVSVVAALDLLRAASVPLRGECWRVMMLDAEAEAEAEVGCCPWICQRRSSAR